MKRVIMGASMLLAVSVSFGFETWSGNFVDTRVETDLATETLTAGYWYSIEDSLDGGNSKVIWPVKIGDEYSSESLIPVLEVCGGICGTALLEKGFEYPYAMVAFDVAGETSKTDKTLAAADASSWDGLCITYRSTTDAHLQLSLGDAGDNAIANANPEVSLPKAKNDTSLKFMWSDFKQPTWVNMLSPEAQISGEDAAKQLVSVRFRIQKMPGSYDFNICAVGPYTTQGSDRGCPERCENLVYYRWLSHDSISIDAIPDQPYTGSPLCPEVIITDHHKFKSENTEDRLVQDADYTVKCDNNVDVGTARMIITASGKDYFGTVVKNFEIVNPNEETTKFEVEDWRAGTVLRSTERQTFDLNGRNANGKNKAKGVYYSK